MAETEKSERAISLRRYKELNDTPGEGDTLAKRIKSLLNVEILDDLPTGESALILISNEQLVELEKLYAATCWIVVRAKGHWLENSTVA